MTNQEIINCYIGEDPVEKLYMGTELVWPLGPVEPNYLMMPLTFEIESGGTIYWTTFNSTGTLVHKTIEYSKDGGNTWTQVTSTTGGTAINVSAGDIVQFRGTNTAYGTSQQNYCNFSGRNRTTQSKTTAVFKAYGNICSLLTIHGDTYDDWATNYNCNYEGDYWAASGEYLFRGMFINMGNHLTDVSNLMMPSWDLQPYAYASMFRGCTAITDSPVLPDRPTGGYYIFDCMFSGCTSLTGVTCLGEDFGGELGAADSTYNWLAGVPQSGVFRTGFYTSWVSGANGIPEGWEVIGECICDDKYRSKFFVNPCDSEDECKCYMCQNYQEGYCMEDPCNMCSGLTGQDFDDCLCQNYNINCPQVDCDDWESLGYESREDCVCQQSYGGDCPDCAANWEEWGYESYEDCMCQIYGTNCPEEVDCSDWENLGYESEDDCSCQNFGYDTNGDPCGEPEEEGGEEEPEE